VSRPAVKCDGVADTNGNPTGCVPSVGSETSQSPVLAIKALGGDVVFESASCPQTDLCEMSRKLEAVIGKFDPLV
jgi:hypothetical protein